MNDFFKDEEKNKLSAIAEASSQWELIKKGKNNQGVFQIWECTYKYKRQFQPSTQAYYLAEGFDDDQSRLLEFKLALVESVTTNQQRIDILFEKLYGDHQMFLGE
jgi:hypothetical protein